MKALLLALALTACSKTSPAGSTSPTQDLRKHLKPDVVARAPADDKATQREFTTDVHGVSVKIVWATWDDGPNKYLLSYHWEVVTPKAGVAIEPKTMPMNPENAGTEAAVVEQLPFVLTWSEGTSTGGQVSIMLKADGTGKVI